MQRQFSEKQEGIYLFLIKLRRILSEEVSRWRLILGLKDTRPLQWKRFYNNQSDEVENRELLHLLQTSQICESLVSLEISPLLHV